MRPASVFHGFAGCVAHLYFPLSAHPVPDTPSGLKMNNLLVKNPATGFLSPNWQRFPSKFRAPKVINLGSARELDSGGR
jgi:hypothetical protein